MIRTIRNLARLIVIMRTLGRHDALFPHELRDLAPGVATFARLISAKDVPGRPGQRLAAALRDLGPSFIKLGQILSTRSDLVGLLSDAGFTDVDMVGLPMFGITAITATRG